MNTEILDKRVKENTNLQLHHEPYFKGLPVQVFRGPLVKEWLAVLEQQFLEQIALHSKVFTVRLDLRFPKSFWPLEGQVLGNDYFDRFKRNLKSYYGYKPGGRNHDLKLVAAREYDECEIKPHFHVVVLLNGNAVRGLGPWDFNSDGLYTKLHEAWAFALGFSAGCEAEGLIELSSGSDYQGGGRCQAKGGCFFFERGDRKTFEDVFFACSYMAKVATKNFNDCCHPFLSTRLKFTGGWN